MHASFSEGRASMAWQTAMARQWGVDVIWWTDHDWRIGGWGHTRRFDFEEAVRLGSPVRIEEPDDAQPGETRRWALTAAADLPRAIDLVDSVAADGARSLRIETVDLDGTGDFRALQLSQEGSRKQCRWPLAARPRLGLAVLPEAFDPADSRIAVEVLLSDHPEGRHRLRYVAGPLDGEPPSTRPLPLVPGQWNRWELDVLADAIATIGGADPLVVEDNSLYEVRFSLEVRGGAGLTVFLDEYRIEPDPERGPEQLLDRARTIAARLQAEGVIQPVGFEISRFKPQPHLNAYGPGLSLPDYGGRDPLSPLTWAVDAVHAQGGVVSLNHMFGPGVYPDPSETPAEREARIRSRRESLVASRALGVDVLEVGYRWRGGVDLAGQLDTWDRLGAAGLVLTGVGVSDSHGVDLFDGWGPWQPTFANENNFVTRLHVPAVTEAEMLHALRAGRASFGDPVLFPGTLDLVTGEGIPMGRIVVTDRASHRVEVLATGVPADAGLHLRHVAIEGTDDPLVVLRDEPLAGSRDGDTLRAGTEIDTSRPGFARVELRGPAGEPLAFSNPITFVRERPDAGLPTARAAWVRGDIVLPETRAFDLREIAAGDGRVVLRGDESPAGGGRVTLALPAGPPASVRGAGSWSWEDGFLLLERFRGPGSEIEVVAGDGGFRPDRLTLARGVPNPFGDEVRVVLSVPRAGAVRVTVHDVRGRTVRVLRDTWTESGSRPEIWDGRNGRGDEAASGVYWIRAASGGEERSVRVVKLR
jgi:hypothetical protein